ncbi:type II toxin-antitoxin system prevent-host-death family antitoxin [Propionimicrobium sp. PCR01-08-3]|uniref:type II toxin-antitoxin system prevent-host-death family antitoxin n=1 Tax=Propionimicrobium sp. PCR01-08-3 TaxID=3052086 RepID=UPI00255C393C|nr:type II toxin-antitoxin system prevent-host-death family antitoxin [Propionimicrobium sp. PCR01-08-3]WIY82368.1 type II toxin-antitoxin system prevent-host-death family antitoxin [Propionimicrobium sp. PCR01-08-3]
MSAVLHVPAALATKKGAGYLAEQAGDQTVVLTNHGKSTAVVMSPENFDELQRALREAANRLISGVTDLVAEGATFRSVEDARQRLHVDR